MARRRKRSKTTGQRDHSSIARDNLDALLDDTTVFYAPEPVSLLTDIEDRRRWHPLQDFAPPRSSERFGGSVAQVFGPDLVRSKRPPARFRTSGYPGRFSFRSPNNVVVCVRRKRRREVMFAKRRTKRGAGARRRRNVWSDVWCGR